MSAKPAKALPTTIPLLEAFPGRRVLIRPYETTDAAAVREAVAESREDLRPWIPWADSHQSLEETNCQPTVY
ncbi:MAG TPA: hypothetical protein VGW38_08720 [Chloroflexota bacterium]|nr:hypothetical protein [Chloroflexota bacterium]